MKLSAPTSCPAPLAVTVTVLAITSEPIGPVLMARLLAPFIVIAPAPGATTPKVFTVRSLLIDIATELKVITPVTVTEKLVTPVTVLPPRFKLA